MASPKSVTAIFDIGKTNKKFVLFDEDYQIVKKQQTKLDQSEDEDGDACEDLRMLEFWIEDKIGSAIQDDNIKVEALNFSTYGASFVHLDEQGRTVTPLYNYLKPYSKELYKKFYERYGSEKQLALQTASPPMGMLNSGFQLYWLKHERPEKFEKIACSLHFPQYLSYLFTGQRTAELTSIGCHTALWNFKLHEYHQWLKHEDILPLLPSASSVATTFRANYNGLETKVGVGVHDSSAALAPYIIGLDNPFMLVSTGTWSITFNPFNNEPLTFEELKKDCLCYLNINGEQVKSSRLFLGNEYSYQKDRLNEYFNEGRWQNEIELDVKLLNQLVNDPQPDRKLKLEQGYNSGPYPQDKAGDWRVDLFSSYKEGYHQLMLDLVSIQVQSIKLAQGTKEVDKIIITGGFSQNDFFVKLLASFFPGKNIYTSALSNASALGAAMVTNQSSTLNIKEKNFLGLQQHQPVKGLNVKGYTWKKPVIT